MNHKHFHEISSTQNYLKEYNNLGDEEVLVTCDRQLSGHGQYGRSWDQYENGLCFSFTLYPNEVLTLSSLEIGVLLCHFFKSEYKIDLGLKWPNDLYTADKKKCGGIIINNIKDSKNIIVGIGLNLFNADFKSTYKQKAGAIFSEGFKVIQNKLALNIYHYIKSHRLMSNITISQWEKFCMHKDSNVSVTDEKSHYGKFIGVGNSGQAIIEIDGKKQEFFSASLNLEETSSPHQK